MVKRLAILAAVLLAAGCHAQVPPATQHKVALTWTAPVATSTWAGCTTAAPCTYAVYRCTGDATACGTLSSTGWSEITTPATRPSATSYVDATVMAGTTYTYTYVLETVQGASNSAPSSSMTVTVPANPIAPAWPAPTAPVSVAQAGAPTCLFSDVVSGPATGGEGGNGTYLSIYGTGFGASQGSAKVTVNGTPVAQYLYWGTDPTGDRQQIGVQVAAATAGSGAIVVTTPSGSCSNLSFAVRPGKTWFIGPAADNSAPGTCATMEAANSYTTPWGLTNYASTTEANYSTTKMRTPSTYYHCMSPGDTLVFLNGVNYPYFDGRGWHSSLTPDNASVTSTSFMTIMARPGATASLGGEGWAMAGIRNAGTSSYTVYSGLTLTGSGANGMGLAMDSNDRAVGNTIHCPSCWGPTGAMIGGSTGNAALGNLMTAISTDKTLLPNGSNKTYHASYFGGSNFEYGWNRIYNTAAYNGFQVNHDGMTGFFNFTIHDNDIADVYGSGINLSTIDPASGYVKVYNNIIHHTGLNAASDGSGGDPHSCLAVKGYGTGTGAGTAELYNNTMYDCNSYLNLNVSNSSSCAVLVLHNQLNVTTNLVNNITYQPTYAGTAKQSVYICGAGTSVGTITGSNNLWYSDSTPGSTTSATAVGKIANPLFVSATNGPWTNYELQDTSPAISAGTSAEVPVMDFNDVMRPAPPSIGALE